MEFWFTQDLPVSRSSSRSGPSEAALEVNPDLLIGPETRRSIITNRLAIQALRPVIADLLNQSGQAEDVTLALDYFLERNELRCAPLVVLIHQGDQLVAALYGRERTIFGIRTGVVQFGDYYGDSALIAKEPFKAPAVAWGALTVLRSLRIHTVRVSFKLKHQNELVTIDGMLNRANVKSQVLQEPACHTLMLKNSFDAFLNALGSHTRRNLRAYRKKAEQKGWKFVPQLGPAEVEAAFSALKGLQGRHKSSIHGLNCCMAALKAVPGACYAGVCTSTGEWVSMVAGWVRNDRYFMLVQLNDSRYIRESVSTVMRSYLIEDLIRLGVNTINFVGGSSDLLRRFCEPLPCAHYLIEKRGALSMIRGYIGSRFFKSSMVSRIIRGDSGPIENVNPADS